MKLYVVSKDWFNDDISLCEIEAVEKTKTFILDKGQDLKCVRFASRINKENLGFMDLNKCYCIALTKEEAIAGFEKYCHKETRKYYDKIAVLDNYVNKLRVMKE